MTLYEWLVAQYEATSCGAWVAEIDEDGDLMVRMGSEHSVVFANMEGSCSECHANQEWTASAHEHGYPLLMAVFEAVADGFAAIEGQVISFDGYADPRYSYECAICHGDGPTSAEVEHSASCPISRLRAAIVPLMAEAK